MADNSDLSDEDRFTDVDDLLLTSDDEDEDRFADVNDLLLTSEEEDDGEAEHQDQVADQDPVADLDQVDDQDQVANMVANQDTNENQADICTFCLEEMGTRLATLGCGHRYHPQCVSMWVAKADGDATCPLCSDRKEFMHLSF